ncbi:glycosyltransferase family 2 protein [Leptolyngbya sp. AN03gr2]|uniref:glycosyltransferase family 2 protein n=1 Tax=unclassified Leptolyngbya TaxID=2650499 RepID=UPI003D311E0A
MSIQPPLVSVLFPVYNAEKYLKSAIDSILKQTYSNFELILLDDGSTDQSFAIASQFAQQDARVQLSHHVNMGLCRTLQKGVSLAQGKYIARMDADDIAHPERFERQVAYLEAHPTCVVLGTAITVIDPENDKIDLPQVSQDHDTILAELLSWTGPRLCHPTVMMRTESVKAVDGYTQDYHYEDIDLFLKLSQIGTLANLPERLLNYRWHLSSITHTRNQAKIRAIQDKLCQTYPGSVMQPAPTCPIASVYYSPYESYCRWLILAHRSGFWRSSLKYLFRVLFSHPLTPKSYWALIIVLVGEKTAATCWNWLLAIKHRRLSSPSPHS